MNERTRITLAIVITAVILFTWQPLMHVVENATGLKLLPPPPTTQIATTQSTTAPAGDQPGTINVSPSTEPGSVALAPVATQPAGFTVAGATTMPSTISIGSAAAKDPTYAMQLDVSPVGGSLAGVVLNDYKQTVKSEDRFEFDKPYGDGVATLATKTITINNAQQDISHAVWQVAQRGSNFVTLSLDIKDGNNPFLTLYKRFTVLKRDEGTAGALGFETNLICQFVNHTDRPMTVSTALVGPTYPPSESARGGDRQVIVGFQGKNNTVTMSHDALEGFTAGAPTKTYSVLDNQPLLWFGAGGNYFNAIIRPVEGMWIKQATATLINPQVEDAAQHEVVLGVESNDIQLAPGASSEFKANVFFGPRLRSLLNNSYYAGHGIEYSHSLEIGGSCAFCTFQWLVNILMSLLGVFHWVLRDWGLSIIALVFVVRACLHPITKRSQINMAKMTKLGPEMEKLKKKYGDDKDGLNKAMMQFYKNQGAAPVLGCLPMFLQMPIWIALYSGLSSTFELRQEPFLYGLTWIKDLAKPDHLIEFKQTFSLYFIHIDGINVIPILMAGAFYLQQKMTPKPVATTPEQAQQQKMMQWMTLLFPIMLYPSPAGLNLYIFTSTCFGIIESKIIRKHIAEREALQPSGPTFVDGEIVRKELSGPKTPAKKGGFMGWFAMLQEKAEQVRKDAEKKAQEQKYKK